MHIVEEPCNVDATDVARKIDGTIVKFGSEESCDDLVAAFIQGVKVRPYTLFNHNCPVKVRRSGVRVAQRSCPRGEPPEAGSLGGYGQQSELNREVFHCDIARRCRDVVILSYNLRGSAHTFAKSTPEMVPRTMSNQWGSCL